MQKTAILALVLLVGCATSPTSERFYRSGSQPFSTAHNEISIHETANPDERPTPSSADPLPLRDVASAGLSAGELTLDQALAIAERTHPALTALRHRIGMAEGDALQAGLWPNPELEIAVESFTPNGDDQPRDPARAENTAGIANRILSGFGSPVELFIPSIPAPDNPNQRQNLIGVSQTIPIWGSAAKAREAATIDLERWRAEHEAQQLELLARVKHAFLKVVYHQEAVRVMQQLEGTFVQILDVSRARLESGDIAEVEVIKAEANHERLIMEAELIRHNLNLANVSLAEKIGDPSLIIERCLGNLDGSIPEVPRELVSKLQESHPRARVWELAQDKANADVTVARSKKWPVPTLGVRYREFEFTDQDTWDFSLGFEIPLFNRNQGEIKKVLENLKREEAATATERNAMDSQLSAAMAAYETRKHRATIFRERILPKMEQTFEITQTSFSIGNVTILEVLDAYRSLSEARLTYLRELFDLRSALVDLERLTGHAF